MSYHVKFIMSTIKHDFKNSIGEGKSIGFIHIFDYYALFFFLIF